MAKRDSTADAFRELRLIERDPDSPGAETILKRALANRASIVVARAAPLVTATGLRALVPDLERAFEHFRVEVDRDQDSVAKVAIVQALSHLNEGDETLLMGLNHVQMQYGEIDGLPADGGADLRAVSIVALAEREHPRAAMEAVRLLTDPYPAVRRGAVRALTAVPIQNVHLLLRLKALQDDDRSDVVAEVYKAIAAVDPDGINFLTDYLLGDKPRDALLAALALGETGRAELVRPLIEAWRRWRDQSEVMSENLLVAIASLRVDDSFEFLLDTVRDGNPSYGQAAIDALYIYADDREAAACIREAAEESTIAPLVELANRYFRER